MKVRATQPGMSVRLLINGQPVFVTQVRAIEVDMENMEVAQQVRYMIELGWLEEVKEEKVIDSGRVEQAKRVKAVKREESKSGNVGG